MSRGVRVRSAHAGTAVGYRFHTMADACGVTTGAGYIKHLRWHGFDLAVKLMTEPGVHGPELVLTSQGLPIPLRIRGELVFALPGGGELIADGRR